MAQSGAGRMSSSCANSVSAIPAGQGLRFRERGRRGNRADNEREEPPPTPLHAGFLERKLISLDSASAAPSRSIEVGAYCTNGGWFALTHPWLTPPPRGVDRLGSLILTRAYRPDMHDLAGIRAYPHHG